MPKSKAYAYTDLSTQNSLYLAVEGFGEFKLSQYVAHFGLNEIPKATCMVAVGRDARNVDRQATIHEVRNLRQMVPATVVFSPEGEWDPTGKDRWDSVEVIFDGYFAGLAYRKVSGKLQPVLHLVHWLVDLAGSSTLSKNQHPSNPTSLVHPAVVPEASGAGAGGPPIYVSHHVGRETIKAKVREDLWEGIKTMLCELAEIDKFEVNCGIGLGEGNKAKNDRALKALERIQGPASKCDRPYDAGMGGMPLPLQTDGVPLVSEAVGSAVTNQTVESFAQSTFWDVMIARLFPMFNMALVPQVDIATVIADTPALGGADDDKKRWHKVIRPEEYDGEDLSAMLSKPLQGVGVYGDWESLTKIEVGESSNLVCIGGHYASDSHEDADGAFLVVQSPPWLRQIESVGVYAGEVTGIRDDSGGDSETTPRPDKEAADAKPGEERARIAGLYDKYAHAVFVANMLRGRGASLSGKLRFDIAPGSIVKIETEPEQFGEGVDALAEPLYCHVARVSININSEGKRAGTTFQFTHVRKENEFLEEERTHVTEHPLFGPDVYVGSPLVPAWEFPP